jgi:hypothetical protein
MSLILDSSYHQGSTLTWIGFSDDGLACTADSDEVLRALNFTLSNGVSAASLPIPNNGTWIPIADFSHKEAEVRQPQRWFPPPPLVETLGSNVDT